mmetsp:Transcript_2352/g.5386  ORF Transcript_2352/g.5386 Transcript_2352/m.5386 type:complete len:330 (-) Transcript_2352:234-1223(-)
MALLRKLRSIQRENKDQKRASRAELRLEKDVEELTFNRAKLDNINSRIKFHSSSKMEFLCSISPKTGPYKDGTFVFEFSVPEDYPFGPPRVHCKTKIFHPNICSHSGRVGLQILHKDWKPVFTINTVMHAIQKLFLEPNLESAINRECANLVRTDLSRFIQMVNNTMKGGFFFGQKWEASMPAKTSLRRKRCNECNECEPNNEDRNRSTNKRNRNQGTVMIPRRGRFEDSNSLDSGNTSFNEGEDFKISSRKSEEKNQTKKRSRAEVEIHLHERRKEEIKFFALSRPLTPSGIGIADARSQPRGAMEIGSPCSLGLSQRDAEKRSMDSC